MNRNSNGYCPDCDIWVHDEETLKNHKIGKPHLKVLQRTKEDKARKALCNYDSSNTRTGMSYYELPSQYSERLNKFHQENGNHLDDRRSDYDKKDLCSYGVQNQPDKGYSGHRSRSRYRSRSRNSSGSDSYEKGDGGGRKSKREQSREYNRRRSRSPLNKPYREKIEPEIKKINGQFYCEPCDTYCARMDVMTSHLSGKNHKKKTKQISRFACDLCLIEVSSAETLQTHFQGMSHIKRAAVLEEGKKETEYQIDGSDVMEELADLRKRCQDLERQNANLQKEVDHLIKFKRNCTESHKIKSEDPSSQEVVLE